MALFLKTWRTFILVQRSPTNQRTEWIPARVWGQTRDQLIVAYFPFSFLFVKRMTPNIRASDPINLKYIWGSHGNPYRDPMHVNNI